MFPRPVTRPGDQLALLVGFVGFTLSLCYRRIAANPGAQVCLGVSVKWSGAVRMRVATEGPAALIRLS